MARVSSGTRGNEEVLTNEFSVVLSHYRFRGSFLRATSAVADTVTERLHHLATVADVDGLPLRKHINAGGYMGTSFFIYIRRIV